MVLASVDSALGAPAPPSERGGLGCWRRPAGLISVSLSAKSQRLSLVSGTAWRTSGYPLFLTLPWQWEALKNSRTITRTKQKSLEGWREVSQVKLFF